MFSKSNSAGLRKTPLIGASIACAASLGLAVCLGSQAIAFADDALMEAARLSINQELPEALSGSTDIERLTTEYWQAVEFNEAAWREVEALQVEIDKLEAILPGQQDRSDRAMRQRYIMQTHPMETVDSLLASENLSDFMRQNEYLDRISQANLDTLNQTKNTEAQLKAAQDEKEALQAEAQAQLDEAQAALTAAQEERAQKQEEAIEDALSQAGSLGGEASIGVAYDGGEQDEEYRVAAMADADPLIDGANWMADRDEFLAEWTERLDAYLEGSALEGQGANFAASAWKYCIDPRWSAAISNTESSKGRICIRPYNAWGWGAADSDPYGLAFEWGSWEESIDAHAKGLADGYGYTISIKNAQKYCPVLWQTWYNMTLSEMARI